MIVPPPGRFARALSVAVNEAGSPPAADSTSTSVVSPPAARSSAIMRLASMTTRKCNHRRVTLLTVVTFERPDPGSSACSAGRPRRRVAWALSAEQRPGVGDRAGVPELVRVDDRTYGLDCAVGNAMASIRVSGAG